MALEPEYKNIMTESIPVKESEPEMTVSIPLSKYEELIGYKKAAEILKKVVLREKYSISRISIADLFGFDLPQEEEDGEE